jgi:hypothetical protein
MPSAQSRNYAAEYQRRKLAAERRGTTFYRSRTTPGRPLDAVRNPLRWQAYIRRHPGAVERALNSEKGLRICLRRALDARGKNRLPVMATKIRDVSGEGRSHAIGRTPHDVEGYVEGSFLEPTDETGGFAYVYIHPHGFAIEICNNSADLIEQLVDAIRSHGWKVPKTLMSRVRDQTGLALAA